MGDPPDLSQRAGLLMEVPLHEVTTQAELDGYFHELTAIFAEGDSVLRGQVLERLEKALWTDQSVQIRFKDARPVAPRLVPFFAHVDGAGDARLEQTRALVSHLASSADRPDVRACVAAWIQSLAGQLPEVEVTAAELRFIDRADATAARRLIELLDHEDDWVRSNAAMVLGEVYVASASEDLPPFAQVLCDLTARELVRPGVAGPFFSAVHFDLATLAEPGFDAACWMLDLVIRRRGPEPDLPTNGLDFHLHEWLAGRPESVRVLMDAGRLDIAIEAATEDPDPSMIGVLHELGARDDSELTRRASWHLAYHFKQLHPRGDELGFVERFVTGDAEWFVLCAEPGRGWPYAVAFYPRADDGVVERCVEFIFPPAVRGEPREAGLARGGSTWFERGYVNVDANPAGLPRVVHVGYRGPPGRFDPATALRQAD